jgi:hypothetical protein
MKKSLLFAACLVMVGVGPALADGVPSRSKLSKLGLGAMQVQSDEAGTAVRGKGFGASSMLVGLNAGTLLGGATAASAQQIVYGHAPRVAGVVVYGGTGFGGFSLPAVAPDNLPNFSGYVSIPFAVSVSDASGSSQAAATGFLFGFGR